MQTAAGVAAGALAFQGIESLMHGFGHAAGYGSNLGDIDRPEVINNYYGDDDAREHEHLSPDIEDRRGESAFSRAVDDNDHGDKLMQTDNFEGDTDDTNNFSDDSSDFSDSSDFDSGGDDNSF